MEEHEKRLNDFRKKAGPDEDYQFADMIAEYGEQVKRVDGEIELERERERLKMEEELARRRAERIAKTNAKRKEREEDLLVEIGDTRGAKQEEMNAVLGLIKQIKDEDNKISRVLKDIQADKAVIKRSDVVDMAGILSDATKVAESELVKTE